MLDYLDKDTYRKLDSITKYPSILTYHAMLDGKRLKEEVQVDFSQCDRVFITEKADGQNMRVMSVPQLGVFLGTRDKLICQFDPLHEVLVEPDHPDDPIYELKKLIVNNHFARTKFYNSPWNTPQLSVWFFEMFGGKIGPHKHYTTAGDVDWRFIDHCKIPDHENLILNNPIERLSGWREHSGQTYLDMGDFWDMANCFHLQPIMSLACDVDGEPKRLQTVASAYHWLSEFAPPESKLTMDDGASGVVEGVVVRNYDRSKIAKLRFEDYERTLGLR